MRNFEILHTEGDTGEGIMSGRMYEGIKHRFFQGLSTRKARVCSHENEVGGTEHSWPEWCTYLFIHCFRMLTRESGKRELECSRRGVKPVIYYCVH